MNCPLCNVELRITDRQGIEIDYCPKCRGVWLDRGEIDKIIERSAQVLPEGQKPRVERHEPPKEKSEHYEYKKHKRKSFLEELFD